MRIPILRLWPAAAALSNGLPLDAAPTRSGQLRTAREIVMPDDASAAEEPTALAGRVRSALESGDLDAIRGLLDSGARWGAPEGPGDADCHNRDQVIAWWASARTAGAHAVVTEMIVGPGTLLVGWTSPVRRPLTRRAERPSAGRSSP
jgi:hypothetical protein